MDYEKEKQLIIETYGKPEFDGMRDAVNESARRMLALQALNREEKKKAKRYLEGKSEVKVEPLQPIDLTDSDLYGFDKLEKDIITAYFQDQSQPASRLAEKFNVPVQKVGALFRDKRFKYLETKYFDQQIDKNVRLSLLKNTKDADPRVTLDLLDRLELFRQKEEKTESSVKVIESQDVVKALELLGNWLAGDRKEPLTIRKSHLE